MMPVVLNKEKESFKNIEDFLGQIIDLVIEKTGADIAAVYLMSGDGKFMKPYFPASSGLAQPLEIPLDENSFPGRCVIFNEPLFENEMSAGSGLIQDQEKIGITIINNQAAVPITRHGRIAAVLLACNQPSGFSKARLDEMIKIAEEFSGALGEVILREELSEFSQRMDEFVVRAVDMITPEGFGHTLRVASLCSELGSILDFSRIIRRRLWRAAVYHDIGKVLMAGREPWEIERFHPREGAAFLRSAKVLSGLARIVETSHERYDGSGFPAGIGGDVIPLESWTLALAEDAEEYNHQKFSMVFEDMVAGFYTDRAESHHPATIEALTALVNSGTLKKILRGS